MRHVLTALLLGTLVAATAVAGGKEAKFVIDGENTKIDFVGTKPGGKHDGGFKKVSGQATHEGDAKTLKLAIEIDVNSMHSDAAKLTAHLKSADFFNAKEHPKIGFVSQKVEKSGTGWAITGDLTMLGKKVSVTIPAQITATDKQLQVTTKFKINRTEWGMNYGKGKIDDDVSLTVAVNAKR